MTTHTSKDCGEISSHSYLLSGMQIELESLTSMTKEELWKLLISTKDASLKWEIKRMLYGTSI